MFSLICVWVNGLTKQSWGCWFETPSRTLWRHHNDLTLQNWHRIFSVCHQSAPAVLIFGLIFGHFTFFNGYLIVSQAIFWDLTIPMKFDSETNSDYFFTGVYLFMINAIISHRPMVWLHIWWSTPMANSYSKFPRDITCHCQSFHNYLTAIQFCIPHDVLRSSESCTGHFVKFHLKQKTHSRLNSEMGHCLNGNKSW